jgi:formyl-CoA transferase
MGLDLRHARGIELLMALWKISDVWMEASAPGTLERAGISNELALAVNPRLVIVRVSTYGQYGKDEYLGRPGYDALAQAYGGMMNSTGDPAARRPAKTFTGDFITALTGWAATMMALWEVTKTGRPGRRSRAIRSGGADERQRPAALHRRGRCPGHTGNWAPGFQPYDTPNARMAGCSSARRGAIFDGCRHSGARSRIQLRCVLAGCAARIPRREKTGSTAAGSIARRAPARGRNGVECRQDRLRRVYSTRDQYLDEHYAAREMTVPVLDRQSGVPIRVYGVVPKMSLTPGRIWRGAPSIGDDTTDILASMLGLSEPEIAGLYADGVVHRTEPFTAPQAEGANP